MTYVTKQRNSTHNDDDDDGDNREKNVGQFWSFCSVSSQFKVHMETLRCRSSIVFLFGFLLLIHGRIISLSLCHRIYVRLLFFFFVPSTAHHQSCSSEMAGRRESNRVISISLRNRAFLAL